jgi:acetylornithine deacetylase/succinyl-diaminopimelate desuccinylase-like protein
LKEIARSLGDPEIKVEVSYESEDPTVTTQDSALYRALEGAVKRRYPEAIVTPLVIPYGTDSNGFRPRDVKSYGFMPAILPAAAIASMHGDAEFVPLDALGPAIQIFFEALRETASTSK